MPTYMSCHEDTSFLCGVVPKGASCTHRLVEQKAAQAKGLVIQPGPERAGKKGWSG